MRQSSERVVVRQVALTLLGGALLALGGIGTADADHEPWVRTLRETGKIIPLEQILIKARQQHEGRLIEAELLSNKGLYVYEVELLDSNGQVREMFFNAETGEYLKGYQEGKEERIIEDTSDRGRRGAQ